MRQHGIPFLATLMLFTLLMPLIISLGPVRMSPYRFVLVGLFLPLVFMLFSGKAGKVNAVDYLIIGFSIWSSIAHTVNHGIGQSVEASGIFVVETLGAYLVGRIYIRSPEALLGVAKVGALMAVLMVPFVIVETLTARNITLEMFDAIGRAYPDVYKDPRWGLDRVQGPFEHPILMGVFFGSFCGVTYFILGHGWPQAKRVAATALITLVSMSGLSSGPMASIAAQYIFMGWAVVMAKLQNRWYYFASIWVAAYIAVDILSNRSPFAVFISYLAFNAHTAYNRLRIFEYGMLNMNNNPIFGIGLAEWERLWFMTASFDMYWLIYGMRYGYPAFLMNLGAFLTAFFLVAYVKTNNERVKSYRLGYLCGLFGFFLCGWTVHFWNATYVLYFFFLGAGLWMLRPEFRGDGDDPDAEALAAEKAGKRRGMSFTRFPDVVTGGAVASASATGASPAAARDRGLTAANAISRTRQTQSRGAIPSAGTKSRTSLGKNRDVKGKTQRSEIKARLSRVPVREGPARQGSDG